MILSHERGFIFIRTVKTGGTSVEIGLSEHCGPRDVITPLRRVDEAIRQSLGFRGPQNYVEHYSAFGLRDWAKFALGKGRLHYVNHMPAEQVRRVVGRKVWDSYYKFSIERNPWDKVISWYHWSLRKMPQPWPSFSEWLRSPRSHVAGFEIYSLDGEIAVDRVLRYESLADDLRDLAVHLGLPGTVSLPNAKGSFRQDRRPYREVINDEDRELIARKYSREIAAMGYEF